MSPQKRFSTSVITCWRGAAYRCRRHTGTSFRRLVQAGVLDAQLGARLDGLAGLRNILVHDYVAIDESRVWQALDQHLGDLTAVHQALGALPELAAPGA